MEQFVKALKTNSEYLKSLLPKLSDAKLKTGVSFDRKWNN